MNHISNKLRSRSGVTLLIALVFLLFCVLVGGSILAAASANGARVKQFAAQQDYLDQRSAILLLEDYLDADEKIQMVITDTTVLEEIGKGQGDLWEKQPIRSDKKKHMVTFQVHSEVNGIQQIVLEMAAKQYLDSISGDYSFRLVMDTPGGEKVINSLGEFSCCNSTGEPGVFQIKGGAGEWSFADLTAYYTAGTGTDAYDFIVNFGAESQLSLVKEASVGQSESYDLPKRYSETFYVENEGLFVWRRSESVRHMVITWSGASIEKEGSAS